jgi:hypothetical protein
MNKHFSCVALGMIGIVLSTIAGAKSLTLGCQVADSVDPGPRVYGVELVNQDFVVVPSGLGKPDTTKPRNVLVPAEAAISIVATQVSAAHPQPKKVHFVLKLPSELSPGSKQFVKRPSDSTLEPNCTAVANW